MDKITVSAFVFNDDDTTLIVGPEGNPYTSEQPLLIEAEGKTYASAVGKALLNVWENLSPQWTKPVVFIDGIRLEDKFAKNLRKRDHANYVSTFEEIRVSVVGSKGLVDLKIGAEFINETAFNKDAYKGVPVTQSLVAKHKIELVKEMKFQSSVETKLVREAVRNTNYDEARKQLADAKAAKATQRRIEQKASAALLAATKQEQPA